MSGSGPSSGLCDVAKGPLHGALSRAAWILGLCSAQLHPEPARLLLQVCGGEQGAQEDLASSSSPASFVPALARAWENPQPCGPSQEPWELCRADKRCLVSGYILPDTLLGH